MSNPNALLQQVLDRPAAEVEAWLGADTPPDFDWRALAEAAGWNALHKAADTVAAVGWARVSRLARDRLVAGLTGDRYEQWRSRIADATLRAELINRHGPVRGDPFLDCDALFEQFLARYGDQYDEVAKDAEQWTELPIGRVRNLRYIKNELDVLRSLDRCQRFADPQVQRWLQVWPLLP